MYFEISVQWHGAADSTVASQQEGHRFNSDPGLSLWGWQVVPVPNGVIWLSCTLG